MNEKRYNGWTNYETWCVNLWLDNEEGNYYAKREMAREAWKDASADAPLTRREVAGNTLADRLKSEFEENNPLSDQPTVYSDLLSAALSEVNWYEIAQSALEDEDLDDDETDDDETEDDETAE